jgi:hypothetical protein
MNCPLNFLLEEFEDTKGEIRIRIPKKNRKHNGQEKKYTYRPRKNTIKEISSGK